MKYFILLILFVFISCNKTNSKASIIQKTKIDSLINETDVENFLIQADTLFKNFTVMKAGDYKSKVHGADLSFCKIKADSLGITKSFYKADFDQNGYSDLLVTGTDYNFNVVAIMTYPNNKFVTKNFHGDFSINCSFPKVDTINGIPVINYYYEKQIYSDSTFSTKMVRATLTYKLGGFIEYNGAVKSHSINKIEYKTFPCYGTCPIFSLVIDRKGTGLLNAEEFNIIKNSDTLKGKYTSTINQIQYKEITQLLNYIDFANLKGDYGVNASDMPGCTLKITYDNGKKKLIGDYGMMGSYGLQRVYALLADLRFNQQWKK